MLVCCLNNECTAVVLGIAYEGVLLCKYLYVIRCKFLDKTFAVMDSFTKSYPWFWMVHYNWWLSSFKMFIVSQDVSLLLSAVFC